MFDWLVKKHLDEYLLTLVILNQFHTNQTLWKDYELFQLVSDKYYISIAMFYTLLHDIVLDGKLTIDYVNDERVYSKRIN